MSLCKQVHEQHLLSINTFYFQSFIGFLLLRSAIGFGESGFTSLAPTVLGDLFDSAKRSIVLALFYFAIPVGTGLGYIIGMCTLRQKKIYS